MNPYQNQHPAHFEAVKPLLQDRKHLAAAHPIFEEMRSGVIRLIKAKDLQMPLSVAVLVAAELLQPTLRQHWLDAGIEPGDVSAQALVVYLPKLFAGVAVEIAMKQPEVFNAEQLNLRNNETYLGWSVDLPGEVEPTVVRLPEYELYSAIQDAYRYPTFEWGWMPVVVVAGDAVAIGGFLVDESFFMCLQGATMSAQNCKPENVYSENELQRAGELAGVHGLEPWKYARWYEYGRWTVQPELFGFTA